MVPLCWCEYLRTVDMSDCHQFVSPDTKGQANYFFARIIHVWLFDKVRMVKIIFSFESYMEIMKERKDAVIPT